MSPDTIIKSLSLLLLLSPPPPPLSSSSSSSSSSSPSLQTLLLPNTSFPPPLLSYFLSFAAVKPRPVIICERQWEVISCQNGTRIDVLTANYGRLDQHTCLNKVMSNTNCRSANSLQIVQGKCNGKNSCELVVNNQVFGDPCKGTFKYLKIRYRCLEYIGKKVTKCIRIMRHRRLTHSFIWIGKSCIYNRQCTMLLKH